MQAPIEDVKVVEASTLVAFRAPEDDRLHTGRSADVTVTLRPWSVDQRLAISFEAIFAIDAEHPLILLEDIEDFGNSNVAAVIPPNPVEARSLQTARFELVHLTSRDQSF
jgi:hypothetical protein